MDVWGKSRLNCVMALYLVVWHRLDQRIPRPFEDDWLDNELLKSIRTTPKIGELCDEAKRQKHIVYIHRCGCLNPYSRPMICSSAQIADVTVTNGETKVLFHNQEIVNVRPLKRPVQGQSFYHALAP
jgi:hypothetical protein